MKLTMAEGGMFASIRLKNFKCYKDSGHVPLAPLTVLIGCNNAGKSTLLQSLLVLSQTLRDPSSSACLVTKGDFVDLGSYYDILHGESRAPNRRISIEVTRDPQRFIEAPPEVEFRESTQLSLSFSFNKKANRIEVAHLELADEDRTVFEWSKSGWNAMGVPQRIKRYINVRMRNFLPVAFLDGEAMKKLERRKGSESTLETITHAHISISIQAHPWVHLFHDLTRVPPHRSHVPFYGGLGEREGSENGRGGSLLRGLSSKEKINGQTLLDTVNEWLKRFRVVSNLRIEELDETGRVRSLVADDQTGYPRGVNVAAMGEGISQILPIVYEVVRSRPHSCLLIEQPEIHLHPALQADLTDLFVALASKDKRQIVVETHSEHLLLRLRTHVANGTISPEDISILFVEKDGEESTVRQLTLKGNGHFTDWPKGFFGEGYKEALELSRAAEKRKRNV